MEALILETVPRKETDMLARILLRDGRRLDVLARGSRGMESRLRSGLLAMSVADIGLIPGRYGYIAKSVTPQVTFFGIRHSRVTEAAARLMLTHVAVSAVDDFDDDLYPRLVGMLRTLHTAALAGEHPTVLAGRWAAAWITVLELLGFGPDMEAITPHLRSDEARALLRERKISSSAPDVSALLTILARHSSEHLPETSPMISWCREQMRMSSV